MALMECRSAEDVRERAKRQYEWHRQQYEVKHCEVPVVEAKPVPAPTPEPAPFIPPAPILTLRMVTVERLQRQSIPKIKNVLQLVSERYSTPISDIVSRRRDAVICHPRQVAMWLAREVLKRSLPEIGRAIGGRDHTTVISGIRKIERLRQADPAFDSELNELANMLRPEPFLAD
jgi:hypothetical protein